MDITLTLSPITPLDVQFNTPSPSPPIFGHPIPWNLLKAHGDSYAIKAILDDTPNVDHVVGATFMEKCEALFDKRYPYVDKVASAYLHDPTGL
ncbi:hypothetical protein Tco_1192574 [Tanacetum coccineum]